MEEKKIKYAYFPGCASKQMAKKYNNSTRKACEALGIELVDVPEFSCCGAGVVKEADHELNEYMNERNFKVADGLDIMTICSTCVINLRKDLFRLKGVGKYENFNVKHWLWVLSEDLGIDRLRASIKKPLTGIKIATYYGCHIVRPSKFVKDHQKTDNPNNFEEFVKALGAIPVDLPTKMDCCGFHSNLVDPKGSQKMSEKYLSDANNQKADIIITNCPFCHMQFDIFQKKYKIPVLHMSEVLCMALGIQKTAPYF
ncbi:CoB--CoM heterodisulfide reductase iron-sulfur subunit B family protein [Patescibacteria group bacterium]